MKTTIIAEEPNRKPFGHVGFATNEERIEWCKQASERGINYFVFYRDKQAAFAVQYTVCEWKTQDNRRAAFLLTHGGEPRINVNALHGPHTRESHASYVYR